MRSKLSRSFLCQILHHLGTILCVTPEQTDSGFEGVIFQFGKYFFLFCFLIQQEN